MNEITFAQAWAYGGMLMWVLALFSVAALALVFYLWYSQRRGLIIPDALESIKRAKDPQGEGSRIAQRLFSQVQWLSDIAAIAPLIGLLGTVLGMFEAFGGIASNASAAAKPVVLAQGVSQAIVTTIFGLVVAIPSQLAYAFFRRRAQRRVDEIEERADEILA